MPKGKWKWVFCCCFCFVLFFFFSIVQQFCLEQVWDEQWEVGIRGWKQSSVSERVRGGCELCERQGLEMWGQACLKWCPASEQARPKRNSTKWDGSGLDSKLERMTVPSHRWKRLLYGNLLSCPHILYMYHTFLHLKYCIVENRPTSDFLGIVGKCLFPFLPLLQCPNGCTVRIYVPPVLLY